MKKILLIAAASVFLGAGCAANPTPVPAKPPQPVGCNSNADCTGGALCMTEGPLIAGQPRHKACVQKGEAVPL